jgi:hypothetical protein
MSRPRSTRHRPLSFGWLILAIVVACIAAVIFLAPGLLAGFVGTVPKPTEPGPAPAAPGGVSADLAAREREAEMATAPVVAVATPAPVTTVIEPVAKPIPTVASQADEAKAASMLATAEERFAALDWAKATSSAKPVLELKATPFQLARARDLVRLSPLLADLFKQLDERDELNRNYDTNPSLISIDINGKATKALPVTDLVSKVPVVVERQPVAFAENQRKAGALTLLIEGKNAWTATELRTDKVRIGAITKIDIATIMTEREAEFAANLKRLAAGEGGTDATTWYAAGRYAYRNRLDRHVAGLLANAIDRDPMLATSIREDKAATLFASVVAHMKHGNQRQADAYMAIITKRYKDTEQGKQARLFYEGRTAELLAAAKATADKQRRDEETARAARITRAQEAGDDKTAAAIKQEEVVEEDTEAPVAAVSGDEGKADDLTAQASKKAAKAMDLGNTNERDVIYGEGRKLADQAVKLYMALMLKEKDPKRKEELEGKTLAANKIKFMCIKYMRPFH